MGSIWVAGASTEQRSDFCTPAKIPESVFLERYRDTDRQHLPRDTKAAGEPQSVLADGKLRFHTLRHTMVPSWEPTLLYVVASLWSSFPKKKAAPRTTIKHRRILQKQRGGTGGGGGASTLCMPPPQKDGTVLGQGEAVTPESTAKVSRLRCGNTRAGRHRHDGGSPLRSPRHVTVR